MNLWVLLNTIVRPAVAAVLLIMAVPLSAQFGDWSEGAYAQWRNVLVDGRVWDSARDTFDVRLRVFDKAYPIDTVSFLVYYPESETQVQGRPAITMRVDGLRGLGMHMLNTNKAFFRATNNRLASNIGGDAAALTISVFDTLNHTIAGTFDMQCTYDGGDDTQKFRIAGHFVIRGLVIEPAETGLAQGEPVTYRVLTAPGGTVHITEGAATQNATADARGVAVYTRTLTASQPVDSLVLTFRTAASDEGAGVNRTIYVDTSFSRPLVLRFPDRRGFQVQACSSANGKKQGTRRVEFHRPAQFRAVNHRTTDSLCSLELRRLPIDSLRTTDTSACLAGVSVTTEVMIAATVHSDPAVRGAADTALVQWMRAKNYTAVGTAQDDSMAVRINGGVYDGKTVRIPCRRQRFEVRERRDTVSGTRAAALHTRRGEIVAANWGVAPAGVFATQRARGILMLGVVTTLDQRTSDSAMIALQTAALLGKVHTGTTTAAQACDSLNMLVLRKLRDSIQGTVPEYLLLYDFTATATVSPDSIDNINQYDRGASDDLPVRHGYAGGNACGASSLTMALSSLLSAANRPSLREAYHNCLQIGLNKSDATTATVVPDDTEQAFLWERAARWLWGDTVSAGMCLTNSNTSQYTCRRFDPELSDNLLDSLLQPAYGTRTWAEVDGWLAARRPVLVSTVLGTGVNPGGGHVILLLGIGDNPEVKRMLRSVGADTNYYIVADPAGHFYANPTAGGMNQGHYGLDGRLDSLCIGISHSGWFGIYPRDAFRLRAGNATETRYTLSFFNDSTIFVRARSRCTFAGNCATNAFDGKVPDILAGTVQQEDVPPVVAILVTDAEGRRTGMRADGSLVREIPGSDVQIAFGEEEDGDDSKGFETRFHDAVVIALRTPDPGEYRVEVTGVEPGVYDMDIVTHNVANIAYDRRRERDSVAQGAQKEYRIVVPTAVEDLHMPDAALLRAVYPDPVGDVATIEFALAQPMHVRLSIVNMMGVELAVPVDSYMQDGVHAVRWNAAGLPSGVYFCRIEAGGAVAMRRITVVR